MMKIWVVDDHFVIRKGLKQILQEESQLFQISGEASNIAELHELFKKKSLPDALILDLSLPGKSGLESIPEIRQLYPKLPILVFSMHPEDQYALRSFKAGASGYLSKECKPEQLVQALTTVIKGEKYITTRVAHLLTQNLQNPAGRQNPHETLSDREFQIMVLIAQGVPLTEIAEKFYLSVKTISTYRARVLKKMGMKTNAELIQYSLLNKLVG